ncbi:MAG TPA: YggT family protein [Burkholderiales bacterium]|jgi:YggT family protein|nr:YggT family protein [Burkholderiales bacterium]
MLSQILLIILSAVYWVLAPAVLLRFYMQLLSLPFRNPVGQFVRAVTDWIVLPLRRIFKGVGYDWASLIAAYLFELAYIFLGSAVYLRFAAYATPVGLARWLVAGVFGMAATVVALLIVLLIAYVVLSWVVRERNVTADMLTVMVAPLLRPVRRHMPLVGGFDLSPLVLGVLLQIIYVMLIYAQAAVMTLIR